jgi:DNA-directed RNA polymerase sigma subunit (sigma70/sigma32)
MNSSFDRNDPLSWYLRELISIQPLTEEEETDLLQQARGQDERSELASRRLIESKLSLVVAIAERYSSPGNDMLDIVEKGNEGLIHALRSFGESSGKTFTIHATSCIEDAISKAIADSK